MAYKFDPSDSRLVADLLDRIAEPEHDLMTLWERLQIDNEYMSLDEALRVEIDFLFVYELREDFNSAGEVKFVESRLTNAVTRRMADTPLSAWTLWAEVTGIAKSPLVIAHIADILLTSGEKRTPEHAASTIAWYLHAADITEMPAHLTALSLTRANTIARSRGMVEEISVRDTIRQKIEVFGIGSETIGPALTLLAALSVPVRGSAFEDGERNFVRAQLIAIGESSNAFIDEIARTLERLAINAAEREFARRWHVDQYLMLANTADHGMRKMHHAQTAADLAAKYGHTELVSAAVLIMQSVDRDTMGWQKVSTTMPISKNVFRAHLRRYRRARNWEHALTVFLAGPSPTGDHEANVKTAELGATGSIRAFVTRTVFGAHGLPERTGGDFMEEEVIRSETITLSLTSILLASELEHIRDRFSPPAIGRIANWMVDVFSADATLARQFSESLALHWNGKFSDSARLSLPLIESAARSLLLMLDEPLYRTQRGKSPGRFPAMDFYVDALSNRDLDPDWIRALRVTLLSSGMNLRNLAAHGFMMEFSDAQSALLLRLAGLFCAMPVGTDPSDLESPTNMTKRRLRRRVGWVWS
ncbi:hypothetical protein [Arthrobacter sp. MYb213]|uniref:hypothetical protein n=1 Tax=Arthrobacter sp. MYb213 TaxID=1848595 RepID=UPI000CFBD0F1|nr:hypothetical protein [Arthrobacter sp. MYb213]PRB71352.1 hypothetical protein CQ011_05480 [Arthrobacter sp. MYb213]